MVTGRLVFVTTIIATGIVGIAVLSFRSQSQTGSLKKQERHITDFENWPIAAYNASLPTDPKERATRQARNKKYDKRIWPINCNDIADSTVRIDHRELVLGAFPVQQSSVVVIGQVSNGAAFLSNDKTGIYSEFRVVIEQILKNDLGWPLLSGSSLEVSREGGRIRFPSGRLHTYLIDGQDMPRVGDRYVLFLARGSEDGPLIIVTGYGLQAGKVIPLDRLNNTVYEAADETVFIRDLRASLAHP